MRGDDVGRWGVVEVGGGWDVREGEWSEVRGEG